MSMIIVEDSPGVRTITMNRPKAMNALQTDAYVDLSRALREVIDCPDVSAAVITGAGGAFCAGQDLKEARSLSADVLASHPFYAFIETLTSFPKVAIAAVSGVAVGAGLTMLPHFDFVVAGDDARFRAPFSSLGVPTEGGSSVMVPAVVGPRVAARLLLLGEWLSATDALTAGLISHLVPSDQVLDEAHRIASECTELSLAAIAATKRLLVAARHDSVWSALGRERAAGIVAYDSPDYADALHEFANHQAG